MCEFGSETNYNSNVMEYATYAVSMRARPVGVTLAIEHNVSPSRMRSTLRPDTQIRERLADSPEGHRPRNDARLEKGGRTANP